MKYNFKYELIGTTVVLTNFESFNIGEILECGQCFRFIKIEENYYSLVAFGKVLYIKQSESKIEFLNTTIEDFENIWITYFDLERDYTFIKKTISKNDKVLEDAIGFAQGIRILNQDTFEMIITFIISQNNRIPQIKQVIKNISEKFGSVIEDTDFYTFPTLEQLSIATIENLADCKAGFRAKYIIDAVDKIQNNTINLEKNSNLSADELKKNLMLVKGIGTKVADCVLLFGYSKYEYFPTDVWIKRIMEYFYFDKNETPVNEIHELAKLNYKEFAGFAQQYLFHYARINNIGK